MNATEPKTGDRLRVTKMSGAGNDFVVLGPEASSRVRPHAREWVRRVCRRGLSVGADGVIFVEPLEPDRLRVRFMNPDGTGAFCGNGTRCAARFARLYGLAGDRMMLDTEVGVVPATVSGDRVDLVLPAPRDRGERTLEIDGDVLLGSWIDAGSPHFVTLVADVTRAPLERWAPIVRRHPVFGKRGVNVNLVEEQGEGRIALRTWERGVEGETLACGSGAVAAGFVVSRRSPTRRVRVVPKSGIPLDLDFTFEPGRRNEVASVIMSGDARVVFETELSPEATWGF